MAQIIKNGNTWGYRVSYYDNHKKRKFINKSGFKRKSDAVSAARKLEMQKKSMDLEQQDKTSFLDYYNGWVETYKKGKTSSGTMNRYKNYGRLIDKYFGDTLLKSITRQDYQKFLDKFASNHAKISVRRFNGYINHIIMDAIDDGIVTKNFTRNAVITGKDSKNSELKYLQIDEAARLKKYVQKRCSLVSVSYYEILFALATGCRYGEITGLTWDCVDFENKKIKIDKTYDYKKRSGFKPTKTVGSVRSLVIDTDTLSMLKKLKNEQNTSFMRQGFRNDKQLVFLNNRHQIPSDTAANKILKNALESDYVHAKNIITFHGLRHTHASILIAKGVNLDYISERLGHASTTITSKVYVHLLKETRESEDLKTMDIISSI